METHGCVPMRWPCGPLEIEQGQGREDFTAEERDTLERWSQPATLELLEGTLVSCLVVTWAAGSAIDEAQQRVLAPLVAAARDRGLSVVGWVSDGADLARAATTARSAGLAALATESGDAAPDFTVLRFRERGAHDWSPATFLGVTGNAWPGLATQQRDDIDAETGPTGHPWIDSNAWYVRLVRSLVNPQTLWLAFDPPGAGSPVPADAYVRAIADTELYGARWMVSLDRRLRLGLSEKQASAADTWAEIHRSLAFFEAHGAWQGFRPVGHLGVMSDYSGANAFLSLEVLNLLARQGSLFRIMEKGRAPAPSFENLNAVVYVDEDPPGKDRLRTLYAFAERGGTLITPPGWEERGSPDEAAWFPRFRVSRFGAGRVAVASEWISDPYLLAEDAQLLMSHAHDRVRVFNPGTAQFHYSRAEDGRSGVLHLVRHSVPRPAESQISAWFRQPWASARTWQMSRTDAIATERKRVERGVEFHLPPVSVYCAVEVSA